MISDAELLDVAFEHVCEHHADLVADLKDEEIRRRARLGIDRARAHGLEDEGAIVAFVSLMFVVSPRFDEQSNIKRALEDPTLAPDQRMKKLFARTAEADWDEAGALGFEWPGETAP